MGSRCWTGGVVVAVLAAGCVGEAPDSVRPQELDVDAPEDIVFTETTGAILGQVVDDELLPIAGARVVLNGEEPGKASARDGAFVFSSLEPGWYGLRATADGHDALETQVQVTAAQAVEIQLVLSAVATGVYSEIQNFRGTVQSVTWRVGPECMTVVQPPFGTCLGLTPASTGAAVEVTPTWTTIVGEASWTPNSAVAHQSGMQYVRFPNVTDFQGVPDFNSPGYFEMYGASPLVVRIDAPTLQDRGHPEDSRYGDVRFRVLNDFRDVETPVVSAGAMIDQTIDLYLSVFYGVPAPAAYTALPDA